MIGRSISHYQILEKLGQGAMGEVYLAQDKSLPRKVALKFLPERLQKDETARKRFIREAESSAAIDHPYICNIFEVGETDGKAFLALEYVDGPTLADKLAEGPLPLMELLKTASEVAEALKAAHAKGIVHRDLKPSNIMYTSTDHVKILDFGLAKLLQEWPLEGSGMESTRTSTEPLTALGLAVGTPFYMSPEQCQGEEVDARSDLFALGVLTYQMATAALPFEGSNMAVLLHAILHKAPRPPIDLNPELPAELGRIIDRALQKDRQRRYQSADEMLDDLEKLRRQIDSGQVASVEKPSALAKMSAPVGLLAALSAALLLWAYYPSWMPVDQRAGSANFQPTHQQVTFMGDAHSPSISPDGQSVAFFSGQKLMLRDIAGGQSLEIFAGKLLYDVQWSPDGSQLLVVARLQDDTDGIFLIPRLGGNPRRIGPVAYYCWSPDGSQLAATGQTAKRFHLVDPLSGEVTPIGASRNSKSIAGAEWQWIHGLQWSRSQDQLLINTMLENGNSAIWTVRPDGTELTKVFEDSARLDSPRWVPQEDAVYSLRVEGNITELIKIRADADREKGFQADVLMAGLQTDSTVKRRGRFTLSADGERLAYTRALEYSNLWSVQIGSDGSVASAQMLTHGTSLLYWPSISPDGQWVAFSMGQLKTNIYKMPLDGGEPTQLTFTDTDSSSPAWSPDGSQIAFVSEQAGGDRVWLMKADGSDQRALQGTRPGGAQRVIWAPNFKILYQTSGNKNFYFVDPDSQDEEPLVKDESVGWIFAPAYSRDGQKLATHWNRVDRSERRMGIWIISLQDSSERFLPGTLDFSQPIGWSPDGDWIYSNSAFDGNTIHAVPVDGGRPRTLFTMPGSVLWCSITTDGGTMICSVSERKSDVWLAEDFDPTSKAP